MRKSHRVLCAAAALAAFCTAAADAADGWGLEEGAVDLQSAGALAFGPDGILLVGDAKAATVYAIDTGVGTGNPANVKLNIDGIDAEIAKTLKTKSVSINDMAVNPQRGDVYLSVTTESGDAALAHVSTGGDVGRVALKSVKFSKVELPNPPEDKVTGEGRRRRNRRLESITDLAYVDGKVLVSGLSNAEAPSTVREITFPFAKADPGVNLEIYHAAHGRTEDYAPVRTFVPFNINGEPNVLAGFTCTPLVKFPVKELTKSKKVQGTTVAELGNRNRPLDMIVYEQNGERFLLMANSARGVMKISTAGIDKNEGLNERVPRGGTAGQPYETIESLQNVTQLDKLNETHAVIIAQADGGAENLKTIELP